MALRCHLADRAGIDITSLRSCPSDAKVPTIAFNWFSALAVPLWHPVAGWVIALSGYLLFKFSSYDPHVNLKATQGLTQVVGTRRNDTNDPLRASQAQHGGRYNLPRYFGAMQA